MHLTIKKIYILGAILFVINIAIFLCIFITNMLSENSNKSYTVWSSKSVVNLATDNVKVANESDWYYEVKEEGGVKRYSITQPNLVIDDKYILNYSQKYYTTSYVLPEAEDEPITFYIEGDGVHVVGKLTLSLPSKNSIIKECPLWLYFVVATPYLIVGILMFFVAYKQALAAEEEKKLTDENYDGIKANPILAGIGHGFLFLAFFPSFPIVTLKWLYSDSSIPITVGFYSFLSFFVLAVISFVIMNIICKRHGFKSSDIYARPGAETQEERDAQYEQAIAHSAEIRRAKAKEREDKRLKERERMTANVEVLRRCVKCEYYSTCRSRGMPGCGAFRPKS